MKIKHTKSLATTFSIILIGIGILILGFSIIKGMEHASFTTLATGLGIGIIGLISLVISAIKGT